MVERAGTVCCGGFGRLFLLVHGMVELSRNLFFASLTIDEKSGTVCRESFSGEFEKLDGILSDIWLVFNDE